MNFFGLEEMGEERGKRVIMNLLGVILNLVCDLNSYRAVNEKMLLPSFFLPRIFYCTSKNPYFCYFCGFLVVLWKMLKWIESDEKEELKTCVYKYVYLTATEAATKDIRFFSFPHYIEEMRFFTPCVACIVRKWFFWYQNDINYQLIIIIILN